MLGEELAIEHTNNHAVPLIMNLKTVANPRILDSNQGSSRYKASTPLFKRKSGYAYKRYYIGPVLLLCSTNSFIYNYVQNIKRREVIMKKFRIEIVLPNGMRVIVRESSDKRSIAMFELASKKSARRCS
jgi:hypothetical protein